MLADRSGSAAKNIALAGHYGSGKSSVVLGIQAGLDDLNIGWVNLSLSSLGIDDAKRTRIQDDGTLAPLTNLVQKEIVKQLLYRKAPANMPDSRYFRIDSFRTRWAALWSGIVAVGFFLFAVLFSLVNRVEKMAPNRIVSGNEWASWTVVATMSVFLGAVWFLGLHSLRDRLRVESVSAGGAAVSLSEKENSYFDEYLDEIVYFFQQTKTEVAIFEDLDRFEDPHIFETLRELNTVLNNSEQIKSRPIRFVYAVRDSIFEQRETDSAALGEAIDGTASTQRASVLESSPSANRTKFFDLVVPMVPFITHRSARDLLAEEFSESDMQPSVALINLVGAHLTDMRLIRNIRNEFEIYSASVLGEEGLKGLTADRLFAMMVYKNLHLEDFEAIRLGTSAIDETHRAFRALVNHQISHQVALSRSARRQIGQGALWDKRAKAAGKRLQKVLEVVHKASRQNGTPTVTHQSNTYQLSSLTSGELWKSLHESGDGISVGRQGYNHHTHLSFAEIVDLVGESGAAMDEAVAADYARLRLISRTALETKEFVERATMAELMARTDLAMPTEHDNDRNLDSIVKELVSPIAHELLAKGYIDENYTLYCSDYHAISISVSAMNFILHSVQEDQADHHFQFDESASIDAVEKEMGARFLEGESVFNIQVFDHYLLSNPALLETALDKLVVVAATDMSFLDPYLLDGSSAGVLVSQLASRWNGIFTYLVENAPTETDVTIAFVDAATNNAVRDLDYGSSSKVTRFFSEHYSQMQTLVSAELSASKAAGAAALLKSVGVQISDLSILGGTQREAVVASSLYPVTRANMSAALGEEVWLALDEVKASNKTVYKHVLANLTDYLDALDQQEVTITRPEHFVTVLNEVVNAAEPEVLRVAQRASTSCQVVDLADLDKSAWVMIVSIGRFAPTAANVSQLIDVMGTSEELMTNLDRRDITDVLNLNDEARFDLAYALAGSEHLDAAGRVRIIEQLMLTGPLEPGRLDAGGLSTLPMLLGVGLVPDVAKTYDFIADYPSSHREAYLVASQHLSTYVTDLPLSDDDLAHLMRSKKIKSKVKRTLVDDVNFVSDRLSRTGAIAICEWANNGYEISADLLGALSEAQAPAAHIIDLLTPHLPKIEISALDRILSGLGDEYEPLTRTGHHRPRPKARTGTEELLHELKRRNRVSSFKLAKLGNTYHVHMRR